MTTTLLREKEERENTFAENNTNNPYDALGIPRGSSSARARRVFLRIINGIHRRFRLWGVVVVGKVVEKGVREDENGVRGD